MKNFAKLLLASLVFFAPTLAQARIVGGNTTTTVSQPDQFCAGGTSQGTGNPATEACLDFGGNWLPTTTNTQTLGTSALVWSNAYLKALNVGTSGITNTGTTTTGLLVLTRTTVAVASILTTIPVTTSYEALNVTWASADRMVMTTTSLPLIATAGVASGTVLVLMNVSTPLVELTDKDSLTSSGLQLGSPIRWLGQTDTLTLVYDGGDYFWHEVAFTNN